MTKFGVTCLVTNKIMNKKQDALSNDFKIYFICLFCRYFQ